MNSPSFWRQFKEENTSYAVKPIWNQPSESKYSKINLFNYISKNRTDQKENPEEIDDLTRRLHFTTILNNQIQTDIRDFLVKPESSR